MNGTLRKRIVLCLLCLAILLTGVACSAKDAEKVVLQCNGIDIKESIYRMYLYEAGSALKEEYIPTYTDEEYAALSQEEKDAYYALLDNFWTTEIDGRMPFEIVRENALESLKTYAFYADACKKDNVAMTDEELQNFTSTMELYHEDTLEQIESLFGVTKDQYISYLAEMDVYASYLDIQASGIVVSADEIEAFFAKNRQKYAEVVVQTVFLKITAEKDAQTQKALAADIQAKIEAGEDFTALVSAYSDYQAYEDGSLIVNGESTIDETLGGGFTAQVLTSNENDVYVVETDLGYAITKTTRVGKVDGADAEIEVLLQDEKYINRVKSVVENNADYEMIIKDQALYDSINDVPEILK